MGRWEGDEIRCRCGSSVDVDGGFPIACDACGRWCHAACFAISRKRMPERKCWIYAPQSHFDTFPTNHHASIQADGALSSGDGARAPSSRVRSSLTAAGSWTTSKTSRRNTSALTTTSSRMPLRSVSYALIPPNGVESPCSSRLHLRTLGRTHLVFGATASGPDVATPVLLFLHHLVHTHRSPVHCALHTALPATPHTLLRRHPSLITPSLA
ncbi:hypothetical protein DFH08DRAFT_521341 [Mycena albidolilacea]|uniref:Zinc finger PHD-type domain-containing protein n=1 Tax=Mycena albidolilacea TaxID=1033008 RepID=A0AAD7EA38_9AGAR|nr:hypothetical protein DFH08DRAFT_521341 [Mycena albidolilacea]